jgi:8-oxo-dGTP pyrophosphatase MutT (NUDIX family)
MPGVWVFPGGAVELEGRDARTAGDAASEDAEELAHRACAIRELAEEAGIQLPADAVLRPWSRWITPEPGPIRFDTRFYVALAAPHSPPRPDGVEIVDAGWFAPQRALELHSAGELGLVFPTIKHLEDLATYETAEDVMAAARDRVVEPVMPRMVGKGINRREVLG